jgi:hypothetical protein
LIGKLLGNETSYPEFTAGLKAFLKKYFHQYIYAKIAINWEYICNKSVKGKLIKLFTQSKPVGG